VSPGLIDLVSFEERQLIGVPIQGWAPDSFLFRELKFLSGRRLEASDRSSQEDRTGTTENPRAVMLGATLAGDLGKTTGSLVEIFGEVFRVVGVYQSFNIYENSSAIVLLGDLQDLMNRQGQVTGFQLVLEEHPNKKALVEELQRQIQELTNERGFPLGLRATPTEDYVKSTSQIQMSHAMAWVTSVIALVIGAIGVLNTMVMSVFERTKEIGILRAIGWRKGRVMRMILYESVLLSITGAVIGILLAIALIGLLSVLPEGRRFIEGNVDSGVMLRGFLIALGVGLAGGVYPAWRGAQMLPTEAIRHE
jgi:putative ABC transport system permease protein